VNGNYNTCSDKANGAEYQTGVNAAAQDADPGSLLNFYLRLLKSPFEVFIGELRRPAP
jgi:hypothetical protein